MKIFRTIPDLQRELRPLRQEEIPIGLVPTMGALHAGHLSLIKKSMQENTTTVCSIFVNPTQFNNAGDLAAYPRNEHGDILQLEKTKCNIVFIPSIGDMYPEKDLLDINFGVMENNMEGLYRPGHFKGVATVVKKLFDIVQPDAAYFGEKDFQQLAVVKNLAEQLKLRVRIAGCETVREADGLAMSSRNIHLTEKERIKANEIYNALLFARESFKKSIPVDKIKEQITNHMNTQTPFTFQYFEIINSETLQPATGNDFSIPVRGCIAVLASNTRLIDNISFN